MQQNKTFDLENHTPQEAIEILVALANNSASAATVAETRNIAMVIDVAARTLTESFAAQKPKKE